MSFTTTRTNSNMKWASPTRSRLWTLTYRAIATSYVGSSDVLYQCGHSRTTLRGGTFVKEQTAKEVASICDLVTTMTKTQPP